MARVIRRHWRLVLLQLILFVGGIALLLHHFLKSPLSAQAVTIGGDPGSNSVNAVAPLDPITYLRVRQVREKLALRNDDFAAMGCSQTQVAQLISTVSTWVSANATTWFQQEQAVKDAQSALAAAQRQINIGTTDQSVLTGMPTLQQNVSTARQQFEQFQQGAADAISASLSSAQQPIWAAARSNAAAKVPSRYRYVQGLTADQIKTLSLAIYRGQDGTASLSTQAVQQLQTTNENLNQNMAAVSAAEAAVLPSPPELSFAGIRTPSTTQPAANPQ
jgi:hypothetical protein